MVSVLGARDFLYALRQPKGTERVAAMQDMRSGADLISGVPTKDGTIIDTTHLIKVGVAWVTILYVVCFGTVALYPPVRALTARYAFHIQLDLTENVTTVGTFITGLVLWNLAAALGFGLFALLFNKIR
jgi:hypothetical protein